MWKRRSELGTVFIKSTASGVQIGDINRSFTIKGLDGPSGIEKAAVYFQGANSNSKIIGNIIEAIGDEGLMTEYNLAVIDLRIDSNTFSGKTYTGDTPGGDGFANQFTEPNVPRQLVVIGGGASGTNTKRITFTNNQITGTAGGTNAGGAAQGNSLVSIDAEGSMITGNTFAGMTTRSGASLRARRPDTTISGNTFTSTGLTATNYQLYLQNNAQTIEDIVAANTFDQGVYASDTGTVGLDREAAIAGAPDNAEVKVLTGNTVTETIQLHDYSKDPGDDRQFGVKARVAVSSAGEIKLMVKPATTLTAANDPLAHVIAHIVADETGNCWEKASFVRAAWTDPTHGDPMAVAGGDFEPMTLANTWYGYTVSAADAVQYGDRFRVAFNVSSAVYNAETKYRENVLYDLSYGALDWKCESFILVTK